MLYVGRKDVGCARTQLSMTGTRYVRNTRSETGITVVVVDITEVCYETPLRH